MSTKGFVFMSNHEKGISNSISEAFSIGFQGHCCQYIADNVVQRFGIKC